MKTYQSKSEIFKNAWEMFKSWGIYRNFSEALKEAWAQAKSFKSSTIKFIIETAKKSFHKSNIDNSSAKQYLRTKNNLDTISWQLGNEALIVVSELTLSGFALKVRETVLKSGWMSEKQMDIIFEKIN